MYRIINNKKAYYIKTELNYLSFNILSFLIVNYSTHLHIIKDINRREFFLLYLYLLLLSF